MYVREHASLRSCVRRNFSISKTRQINVYKSNIIAMINPIYCRGKIVWYALFGSGKAQLTLFWQLVFLNAYENTRLCVFRNWLSFCIC